MVLFRQNALSIVDWLIWLEEPEPQIAEIIEQADTEEEVESFFVTGD
jgi:hypothetical protein